MVRSDQEYFPYTKGNYQIYSINETQYSISADPLERQYELMVMVVDSFLNAENDYVYVLHRSTRDDASKSWVYLDTWSATVNSLRAVVSEETLPLVKISFPASVGRKWDGNAFNTQEKDEYKIITKGPHTTPTDTFEDCITVEQEDNKDFIVFLDKRTEVYARYVGLVYREVVNLHYCTVNCTELQQIEYGIMYTQTLKEHGVQ